MFVRSKTFVTSFVVIVDVVKLLMFVFAVLDVVEVEIEEGAEDDDVGGGDVEVDEGAKVGVVVIDDEVVDDVVAAVGVVVVVVVQFSRQAYEKLQTRSALSENANAIRDEVTMGLPNAAGTKTELPRSEKLETSTICMELPADEVTKSTSLSGDISRLNVCVDGVVSESKRSNVGLYRNRMIIPF